MFIILQSPNYQSWKPGTHIGCINSVIEDDFFPKYNKKREHDTFHVRTIGTYVEVREA